MSGKSNAFNVDPETGIEEDVLGRFPMRWAVGRMDVPGNPQTKEMWEPTPAVP